MKHSVLRLCSAALLLGICVALLLGVIAAVAEPPQAAWTSVRFFARGAQRLCIYDAQGKPVEQVQTDEAGEGTSSLLPSGTYYAACADGFVGFCLREDGTLYITDGGARAEGTRIVFLHAELGTLTVEGVARGEWEDLLLWNESYRRREVIRSGEGERISCVFDAIPYGSYRLEANGELLCTVTVSAQQANVVLTLP